MTTATSTSILFIDAAVADSDALLANVDPSTEVVRLSADRDGLAQIAEALAGREGVAAVHIVSHGAPGALTLGSSTVDAAALDAHAAELATIRDALADGADLLLYGCNVAEGEAGQDFIAALAEATGADVAASEDTTGAAAFGGDWTLEASTGAIEAQAVQAETYADVLGADSSLPSGLRGTGPWSWGSYNFQTKYDGSITDSDPENPMRSGNKWDRYALDGVAAGTRVYVYMGNSSTVDDYLQIDRSGTIITQNDDGADGERSYDAFVTWIYQPGDVIRATTYSPGYRGSYSLYIGTSSGVPATPTDIGDAPAPTPPPATAPTFTDSHALIATYNDGGANDSFANTTGTLTATDSTPTSTLRFSGGGTNAYGTLAVSSNGNFAFTPDAEAINALAAGETATATFNVSVSDGALSSTKQITVNLTGANDAPTLVANAALPAVLEDAAEPAGLTVEALFAPRFADVDNGSSLGGIVIVGDASTADQGAWEYSTDGGTSWHSIGAVSADAGVALSATALLRFVPAADWNGTPGSLTVHAADDDYAGGYTSGATRVEFDTTADAATSGVSAGSRTISTSVIAVNDAPTFTVPTPIVIALGETSAADGAPTFTPGTLEGTLAGTDVEDHTLHFGIRGAGAAVSGTVMRTGSFGTLSLDETTGAWSYTPTNMTGINALPEGAVATDMFQVKVIDQFGAESVKTLSVTITGTNDLPVQAAVIDMQTFNGGVGGWKFQIPANVFADAEGLGFTYTVDVIDGNGNVIDSITTAEQQGTTPSDWLSFDAASRTLSGTPPPGGAPMMTFRVTATDSENQVVTHSFDLRLPPNTAPVSTNDRVSVEYGSDYSLTAADFGAFLDAEGTELAAVGFTSMPIGLMYVQPGLDPIEIFPGMIFTRAEIDAGMLRLTNVTSPLNFSFRVNDGYNFSSYGPSYRLAVDVHQGVALDPESTGVSFADTTVTTLVRDTSGLDTWTNVYTTDALSGIDNHVEVVVGVDGGSLLRLSSIPENLVDFSYTIEAPDGADLLNGTATNVTFSGPQATVNAVLQALQVQFADPNTPGANVRVNLIVTDTTTTEVATRSITLSPGQPSLNLAADAYYAANGEPQALNPALALSLADQSNGALTSAKVQIYNPEMGDVLGFLEDALTKGDITGQYDDQTGVMTLTSAGGEATLDQWTTALQSITFQALIGSPASTRYLTWTVSDGNSIGYGSPGNTRILFTPANELPTVTHLADQVVAPGNAVSFNIGEIFSDTDSQSITYSAELANGENLPEWLSFDAAERTFSGNPPAGTPSIDIKVVGTDTDGGASSTTFSLILASETLGSSAANNAGSVSIDGTPTQGQTLTAAAPSDADGYTGTVTYQWQVSADSGTTWIDITGARGQGGTLALAESEAGKDVRVQAFYNDDGGSAEMPVSDAVSVANVDATGSVVISGVLTPGETLVASISDADGLGNAVPTYQWFRDGTPISGAEYSAYTLTNDDGGAYIRVDVSYTDDQGTVENRSFTTASEIQLGVVAPNAADDAGTATEASGVANAIAGSDASGNLLANDSDVNGNIDTAAPITSLRSGGAEGVGDAAALAGGVFTIAGQYGTLTVNQVTGAYSYAVNQNHDSVQALQPGQSLQDAFNYTLADLTGLSDTGALTITIDGANDAPTLSDLPTEAVFTEDVAEAIRTSFSLVDPDGGASFALRLTVTQGTVRGESPAVIPGVTVTGNDTGVLTISGTSMSAVQSWLGASQVLYTSAPNENGDLNATLTWAVQDGASAFMDAGTTALNVSQANNAPIVDVGGADTTGNDFTTTFRPRGAEVAVVASDIAITDIDPADTLGSATVTIAAGAFDNVFGTLYETLRSSAGERFTGSLGEILISGNGTAQVTFTGPGTHADYQAALQTVLYNNSNPNAFSGDRSITISVSDTAGQASNAGSFTTAAPNALIAVGQRIFIDGVDSGYTVGQVVDTQHFVASGSLSTLAPGATLEFYGAGSLVTSAVHVGPIVATTTIEVPWTPVIDMSGDSLAGRDHAVTYTEGQAGVAIARPDASITDQDGNIASALVTLTNPQDGGAEKLFISPALVTQLLTLGITVGGNDTHAITLSGNKDATFFQIGLRAIQYANTSDHPDALTARVVQVTSIDVDGNTGVGAQTTINLVAVNDAPTGTDTTVTAAEDTAQVLNVADFGFVDVDGNAFASLTVVNLPASGTLALDGVAVTAGQVVTVADIAAGKFVYTPAADISGAAAASFDFKVQDNGGTANGGVELDASADTLTFDLTPTNDAPVMTAGQPQLAAIGEDDLGNAGQQVSDLVGTGAGQTGVADADTLNNGGAGNAPEAVGRGIAVHALTNVGPAIGGAWEYSIDGGANWLAVGAVSEGSALLLGATDRIRFVPDGDNATTATFSYYLWDGASGAAGSKVDAATRGGQSAFSTGGDTATIEVTPVNDAATVDLNGGDAGTGFTAVFRPRGEGVAVVGNDIAIADVDRLDAGTPDTLVSATVSITGGALDNLFGTTYETLHSTSADSFAGSMGAIAITGNGTGEHGLTDATSLTLSGAGTRADYEAALKTVIYDNANPNAYSGDRTIAITVRDASVSTGDAADGQNSAVSTTTVQVPWTPVIDANGDAAAGRNASVSYTEHMTSVAIAASDAAIVDQDGNIASVTVTLTNPLDGAAEKLFIAPALVTQLNSVGITITGNDSHTIVLTGDRDGTVFQLALRAIQYVNASHAADLTERVVSIAAVDQDGNTGVNAQTTINLVAVNDAPEGIDSAVTLDEDTSHTFAMADFDRTADPEGDALQSVVITTLPGAGTLTLDGVAVTAGQEIAVADVDAGKLVYTPAADANGVPISSFTFQLRDTGGTAVGGVELDATPNTLTLNVNPVNDAPTSGSVTISGSAREGATLTAVPVITDVDRTPLEIAAATTYQWQVRAVPNGAWTDVAGATAGTFVPTAAERNHEVRVLVTYTDVSSPLAAVVYDSAVEGQATVIGNTDGDIVLLLDSDLPICIWDPEGDVDVTNTGTGTLTVEGLPHGGTLTVDGEGDTTLSNPLGDVIVNNAGPGTVTVTGLVDPAVVTTSGGGEVVVDDPQGGVDLVNNGAGEVTVRGLNDGETLDVSGNGPTTVADPDGDLTIANAGPGTVTATGVNDGATVTTGGNGPVVIGDPEGSLELANQGPGTATVDGLNDDESLTVSGPGQTTVSNPDGDFSLTNNGTGYVTVTGVTDGADVTTAGTGDVHIDQPQGDLDLVNNLSDGGVLYVGRAEDGASLNVSGPGPTWLANPDGDLTIANAGPGLVTARCLIDGKTVTTSGAGNVVVGNPRGDVVLVNQGPGAVTVEELHAGQSVDVSGAGPTTVDPDGDATVNNAGPGVVSTTGVANGATLGFGGNGPQAVDLTGIPAGGNVTLNNAGGANVEVRNLPADAVVHAGGSGDLTVSAPVGDLTIDNDGTGTVRVDQPVDGATVTKTGTGPAVIDEPAGSFTLANDDTGLVTVRGIDDGETVGITGTGPVAVESNLAAGERVVVNTTANSNVQLSNLGAGVIDVVGDLTLDGGDALSLTLNGDGTTELTVAGAVSLAGTPLHLQLDPDYDANLGDTITLLDNDGGDAITGTFDGLPEGAPVYVDGQLFSISYVGGTGNDVVLTRINDGPTGAVTVTGTAKQGETLTASHTLADTDGLGTVRYQWMADGALLAVGASYVVTQEAVGKAITAVATYTDAEGTAETVTSAPTAPVANVNDAPTGQVLVTGTPSLGQTLVASHTLADADGLGAVSYQWQADGADIAGAAGSTLLMGREQAGKAITVVASYVDGQGSTEHVSSAVVADGSNVPAEVQSQVPGIGSGGNTGDGNGDGVQDTLQPSVVSTALEREGGAPSTFVTLVVDSVDGKVREGSTDRLMEFTPVDAPSELPSWAETPAGEIGFTAAVDTAGVTKNFSLYVDADLGINGYWSKNADGVLVNLASEAYGGRIVEEGDKLRLDFQITEGGEFDHGTAGDDTIVNHGAAGHASLSLIGYTVDTPVAADGVNMWD